MVKVYIFKKYLKNLLEKDLNEKNFDDIVYYFEGDIVVVKDLMILKFGENFLKK